MASEESVSRFGVIHTQNDYAGAERVVPRLYLLTRLIMEIGAGK